LIPNAERNVCGDIAYRRYKNFQVEMIRSIKIYLDQGYTLARAAELAEKYNTDTEMDESYTDDTELDDKAIEAESEDDDLTVDPFFIGGAMGFAYEKGFEEGRRKRLLKEQSKRRKRKKFSDDSD
jgi:DNA-binding transcriptional MerR regulator